MSALLGTPILAVKFDVLLRRHPIRQRLVSAALHGLIAVHGAQHPFGDRRHGKGRTRPPRLRAQAFSRSNICSTTGPGRFAGALKYAMPALKKRFRQSEFARCA